MQAMPPHRKRLQTLSKLQAELAFLSRTTDHFGRRSDLYADLERSWFVIAQALSEFGELTISGLANQLALDGTTVTRQVAAMEKQKLLVRAFHPEDGRTRIVSLTARGKKLLSQLNAERTHRYGETLSDWTDDELNTLASLIRKLNDSIISGAKLHNGEFGSRVSSNGSASR